MSTDRPAMRGYDFFQEGGGSCNSHEMRRSGLPRVGIIISPSLRTYIPNIGIWQGSIPMYASMFLVTLAGDLNSFQCGLDTGIHDAHMIYDG